VAYTLTLTCALSILAITALLVFELYTNSAELGTSLGGPFLSTSVWDPVAGEFERCHLSMARWLRPRWRC
jgi:ABC-type phosphate transport system permease subunit